MMDGGVDRVDWVEVRLGEVCEMVMGQSPPSATYNTQGHGIPFFQGKKEFGALFPQISTYCSKPLKIAEEGAVLFSVRAPVGPSNISPVRCCIGRGLAAFRPHAEVHRDFLLHFFRCREPSLSDEGTGSTFKAVSKSFLSSYRLPLPPLLEQRAIVGKIEALFSELDKGVEQLETARRQLKHYRQSVLKAAFEGKLTAEWRAAQPDRPAAEELLAQIQTERDARYRQQLADYQQALKTPGKKKPRKPAKPKDLPPLTEAEQAELPELPEGWRWVRLGALAADMCLGKMLDKQKNKGHMQPYLRNINVRWFSFDLSDLLQMRFEPSETSRYSVGHGDLVVCEGGEPGRCAVWKNATETTMIQKALHRVRFSSSYSADFGCYFLNSAAQGDLLERFFTGTTIKHLTGTGLERVPFPLAPLEEQRRIVAEIERRFSVLDELEAAVARGIEQAVALRQSILKKAFAGRLLSAIERAALRADPAWEPAAKLLEKIQGERAAQSGCGRKR